MRFHTSRDGRKGDVLVVSKVSDAETCHVAYIDALANRDAIALARHVADRQSEELRLPPGAAHRGRHGPEPDVRGAVTPTQCVQRLSRRSSIWDWSAIAV